MIRELPVSELSRLEDTAYSFRESSPSLVDFDFGKFCVTWKSLLESGAGIMLVDERDGEVVGAMGCLIHPDHQGNDIVAEELCWYVQGKYRGSGILLYRAFEAWAEARGADNIQMVHLLDIMPEKVRRFYVHEGFRPIEVRYIKRLAAA